MRMAEAEKLSQEVIARIEALVRKAESLSDPAARTVTIELVQAVMDLHSAALGRIVEIASLRGSIDGLLSDDLASSILVLHGLHPEDVLARVARAMDKLSRHFDSRGARVELLNLDPGAIRVRYTGRRRNASIRQTIEDAIAEAAPEIASVVIEGLDEEPETGFVPLSVLTAAQT